MGTYIIKTEVQYIVHKEYMKSIVNKKRLIYYPFSEQKKETQITSLPGSRITINIGSSLMFIAKKMFGAKPNAF